MRKKPVVVGTVVVIAGLATVGWLFHKPLLAHYYVRQLAKTPEDQADAWVDRTAGLGDAAMPRLFVLLKSDGPGSVNVGKAMAKIVANWPDDDPKVADLAARLTAEYKEMSPGGRHSALGLTEPLLSHRAKCKELVHAGLKDGSPDNREMAVVLAMRKEIGLASAVVPLMSDPAADVRRAAMISVGASRELVSDEELLPWLHDSDPGVREMCETALLARGLRDNDVKMGRLVTDPYFLNRLEVIGCLQRDDQVDPNEWLHRLSRDPVPAVRAAAARVGIEPEWHLRVDFLPRVREMAQSDPDGTVRQIAADLIRASEKAPAKLPNSLK
jgi:hypothetical protein